MVKNKLKAALFIHEGNQGIEHRRIRYRDGSERSERKTKVSSDYQIITKVKQEVETIIGKSRPRRMRIVREQIKTHS